MNNLLARLYTAVFLLYKKSFLSITLLYWLLFGIGLTLYFLFPIRIMLIVLPTLYALLFLFHRKAKKDGYIRFQKNKIWKPTSSAKTVSPNEQIQLTVTGKLATSTQEGLLTHFPATYWYTKRNEHIIMAQIQQEPKRFLYQFIIPDNIHKLDAGTLFYQREEHIALYISFDSEWLPQTAEPIYYSKDAARTNYKRIELYLTFSDPDSQSAVLEALQTEKKE